jgi:hypothetical protein
MQLCVGFEIPQHAPERATVGLEARTSRPTADDTVRSVVLVIRIG